MRSIVLKLV